MGYVGAAALLGLVVVAPMALTAIGARRRGMVAPLAVLAGVFFPFSWAVWYVRDEHPYRRAEQRR